MNLMKKLEQLILKIKKIICIFVKKKLKILV